MQILVGIGQGRYWQRKKVETKARMKLYPAIVASPERTWHPSLLDRETVYCTASYPFAPSLV
jgi:hypothetical protein